MTQFENKNIIQVSIVTENKINQFSLLALFIFQSLTTHRERDAFSNRERKDARILKREATSVWRKEEREGASSGQVDAMPSIIIRKKEEKKERKGIINVAFLLPDDACVRKVDLKADRKERNESEWCTKERRPLSFFSLLCSISDHIKGTEREKKEREHNYRLFLSSSTNIN
jgi:hypothetical protein